MMDGRRTGESEQAHIARLTDEIERLRGIINDDRLEGAADEIERLREALQNIADGPRDVEKSYVSLLHEVQSEARKALGDE